MNVLKYFPYRWRHYITHPWEFFEDCWLNVKAAYQRVTRGFAYRDLFSIDSWFLEWRWWTPSPTASRYPSATTRLKGCSPSSTI